MPYAYGQQVIAENCGEVLFETIWGVFGDQKRRSYIEHVARAICFFRRQRVRDQRVAGLCLFANKPNEKHCSFRAQCITLHSIVRTTFSTRVRHSCFTTRSIPAPRLRLPIFLPVTVVGCAHVSRNMIRRRARQHPPREAPPGAADRRGGCPHGCRERLGKEEGNKLSLRQRR